MRGPGPPIDPVTGVADIAVTSRQGGVSTGPYATLNLALHVGDDPAAVAENRRRAAASFGADPGDLVFAEQVHGNRVAEVGPGDGGRGLTDVADAVAGADALVTTTPGLVLVTMVADCLPVALVDPVARVLGSVHAGWRGTAADVVGEAVRAMAALGARPERLVVVLGPCIGPRRYQVGPEVADAVGARLGEGRAAGVLAPDGPGHWRLDLAAANRLLLADAGVSPAKVRGTPSVTGVNGPYFSDRAARPCGRFALLARLRP